MLQHISVRLDLWSCVSWVSDSLNGLVLCKIISYSDTGRHHGCRLFFPSWDNNKGLIAVPGLIEPWLSVVSAWSLKAQLYFLQLPCFRSKLPGITKGIQNGFSVCVHSLAELWGITFPVNKPVFIHEDTQYLHSCTQHPVTNQNMIVIIGLVMSPIGWGFPVRPNVMINCNE